MDEATQATGAPSKNKGGRPRKGRPSRRESIDIHRQIVRAKQDDPMATQREIADKVGVHRITVHEVLAKYGINQQELEEFQKNRADLMDAKGKEILAAMTAQKIGKASIKDLTIAYGTLFDKSRLERGEATSNVAGIVKILGLADKERAVS